MNKKIRVYYHKADLDGLCSAAIAYRCYEDAAEYCGVDYGDPLDLDPTLDRILFVDFSPPQPWPDPMPENIVVLDHHKTSIGLPGIIDTERAACEIVWEYFNPGKPQPKAVSWIAAADLYRKVPNWESEVVPFCVALQTEWPDIKDQIWAKLFNDPTILPFIVKDGWHMLRFSRAQDARVFEQQAFSTFFCGCTAVVLIGGVSGTQRFLTHDGNEQLLVVVQYRNNRRWYYSLRSRDGGPDVSKIAAKFGGGGHQHAAGFSHEDLLV